MKFARAVLLGLSLAFGVPASAVLVTPVVAEANLVDINSATKEQLDVLPGIGPKRAARIIKGRPYKGKDELVGRRIISKRVYDGIKDKVIAKQK